MAPRKRTTNEPKDAEVTPAVVAPVAPAKPAKAPAKAAKPKKETAPKVEVAPEPAPVPEPAPKPAPKPAASRKKAVPTTEPIPETPDAFTPNARKVMEAIQSGKAVEFIFKDAETNPPRTFEARQLVFDVFTQAWFAWGWDRRYNAERHHCLDHLAEINLVEGPGRAAQGPYAEGTPANQIGGWRGGEAIPVKAVLQKQWIFAVKQSPAPFPDFRMEDIEDGKAQVTFVGTDLRAIARWCMQFGDGILVQEPQRLVDRMKQVGFAWAGKAAAPAPPPAKAKAEPKHEPKPEHRHEPKPEPKHEAKQESRRHEAPRKEPRESREPRESETPKAKPGRIEVRIERL